MTEMQKINTGTTMGDTMKTFLQCKTVEQVAAFMAEYRKETPNADGNIRHMLRYCDDEIQLVYGKLLKGEAPNRFDYMSREDLIAELASSPR